MYGMFDPRMRQQPPGMGMAPPGPVPAQQIPVAPGFRPPGMMPPSATPPAQSGLNPMALMGMASMMNSGGRDKSIAQMDPRSFDGVIEGMGGADAQKYLAGLPGQGGGFLNWLRGLF